jgi:hypothetical protein
MSGKDLLNFTEHARAGRTGLLNNKFYWKAHITKDGRLFTEFAGKLVQAKNFAGTPLLNEDGTPRTFRLSGTGDGTTITWLFVKDGKEYSITEDYFGRYDQTNKSWFSPLPIP